MIETAGTDNSNTFVLHDLQLEMLFDQLARWLQGAGKSPDEIEERLIFEAERVAQELRDEITE